jgi:tripartite-type tricarboxylate transporter receptor subunit TctC
VLLEKEAGIKVVHVPLGATRRVPSLLGGEVEAICVPLPEVAPQVQAGQARFLAVSTAERHPLFPDVPTFTELGYGIVMDLFRGISVPKGTPQPVVQALMEGFLEGSQDEGFLKVAERIGFIVGFQDSAEFTRYLQEQQQIVAEAMKFGGLIQ